MPCCQLGMLQNWLTPPPPPVPAGPLPVSAESYQDVWLTMDAGAVEAFLTTVISVPPTETTLG